PRDLAEPAAAGYKDLALHRQIGASRFHQENTGQVVQAGNVSKTCVLPKAGLAGGATFGCGFVCSDQAFASADQSYAADNTGAGELIFHAMSGQRGDFQEVRALVQQGFNAVPRKELAPLTMPGHVFFPTALGGSF